MKYLILLLFLITDSLYLQAASETFKPNLSNPSFGLLPGNVRHAASGDKGTFLLVESEPRDGNWTLVGAVAHRSVTKSLHTGLRATVAMDDQYVVWINYEAGLGNLNFYRIEQGSQGRHDLELFGVTALIVKDKRAFAINRKNGGSSIHQIDLESGKTIWTEPTKSNAFALMLAKTDKTIMLLDPAEGAYREYSLETNAWLSDWMTINSSTLEEIRRKRSVPQPTNGSRVVEFIIHAFAGKRGSSNLFLVAMYEKSAGQYVIEVDSNGREIGRHLLAYPGDDRRESPRPDMYRTVVTKSGLVVVSRTGRIVKYGGINQ